MALDSVDTLLAALRRTQLLTPAQVDEVARELGGHFDDPIALGDYLVEIDWLTAYQFRLLLTGRWDELTVGSYQVLDRLGEGGVSEVFKAWDTVRGRVVALKVLRHHLASQSAAVRQFRRELQAVKSLSHPNIVKTYDAGQAGALHYFAMEFVEGMDLGRFVEQAGPLPVWRACDYVRQVAQALQHAHQLGLVHRDVKPANLFLLHPPLPAAAGAGPPARPGPAPVVKVLDWGLARCLRDAAGPDDAAPGDPAELEAEKGHLIGTADYIAPEQARDPTLVDIRADLYGLGGTLFYLLTGRPPFPAPSLMQKLLLHQEAEVPSVCALRPDVPAELDGVLQKMLAKRPEDRYEIPLFVVAPLRRFCPGGAAAPGLLRPGSSAALRSPSSGSLLRPNSAAALPRPGTPAPGTAMALPRPSAHGQDKAPTGR